MKVLWIYGGILLLSIMISLPTAQQSRHQSGLGNAQRPASGNVHLVRSVAQARYPIRAAHPRLLLTPVLRAHLRAAMRTRGSAWPALQAQADRLATYRVFRYTSDTRSDEPDHTIFYDYEGQGWYDATMTLALAYQLSGTAKYADKLAQLADEMIRAQNDPGNHRTPDSRAPLQVDDYYPTRYLGPALAIIYDWCYDRLGAPRRARMVRLMNAYFDDLRANGYQVNDHPDGNYFTGHLIAAAYMGYASYGDNPRAQAMIAYARMRFDGTPSRLVARANRPTATIVQAIAGGDPPAITLDGGPRLNGAPWHGGFSAQGWAYGTATFDRLIDYLLIVRSATGEDLLRPRRAWFRQIVRAQQEALLPDRFRIDPSGDWGSDYGAVINRQLALRLAYVLAGTPDGSAAQHFAYDEIAAHSPYAAFPDDIYQSIDQPAAWETMLFGDPHRPSTLARLPLYGGAFGPAYPRGVASATNGALPYFFLRSDWEPDATWAVLHMGAAWYDDHQHADAGQIVIDRGADYLLVDASNWKGAAGSTGIVGSSFDETAGPASAANTLYVDDSGDFQRPVSEEQYSGGQGIWGEDQVIADEQNNTNTYVRSDLSSAYNRGGYPADQAGRKLVHYYRSVAYVRPANVFVVYDQVALKPSHNRRGLYRAELRWHVPTRPRLTGHVAQVTHGASRLDVSVLLPARAALTSVDESHNPDPCEGATTSCTTYGESADSGTWRIEVSDLSGKLDVPYLTVLRPVARTASRAATAVIVSQDRSMIGARLDGNGRGDHAVVLFNARPGQAPAPISAVSYTYGGPRGTPQVLCGMEPGVRFAVVASGALIRVHRDRAGRYRASAAGVLHFTNGSR